MAGPGQDSKPQGIEWYGGYQVYSDSGVDLTLLRANLQRSLEERWEDACRGAAIFEAFHRSRPETHGRERKKKMFDPQGIVRRLKDNGVQFVVVGGLAMIARGSAYLTKDLDLCYERSPANLAALVAALAPLHPYLRGAPAGLPFRLDVPTLQAGLNFTLTTDCGDLDLLGEVSGLGAYPQVLAQSDECVLFDMAIHILSLDGLIAAKKAAGRTKDRQHLLELEELKKLRDAAGKGPASGEDRPPENHSSPPA
jgi:predicted nucleotidyltransferase